MEKKEDNNQDKFFFRVLVALALGAIILSVTLFLSWSLDINVTSIVLWSGSIIIFSIISLFLVLPHYWKIIPTILSPIILSIYINYAFDLNILPSIAIGSVFIILILFVYLAL